MVQEAKTQGKYQVDHTEPNPERQAELRAAFKQNTMIGREPYADVSICNYGELSWIIREQKWSGKTSTFIERRVNLSGAKLIGTNLSGIVLEKANLSGANLEGCNMSGASLVGANLSNTNLFEANLSDAVFGKANLSGAVLNRANLKGVVLEGGNLNGASLNGANLNGANLNGVNLGSASLIGADLSGADLSETNLSGTDLSEANLSNASIRESRMDTETKLTDVTLNSETCLGDVLWNGVALNRVDWSQVRTLGDEGTINNAADRQERIMAYREVARAYRGLSIALQSQGLSDEVSNYRLRGQRIERRGLFAQHKFGQWVFSWLLNLLSGNGERPQRAFAAYVLVILCFAIAYDGVTHFQLHQLTFDESLVLSLTAFHGRGFFPGTLSLGDWVARIGAIEAVIGLFIELTFIATFSRRFLGN